MNYKLVYHGSGPFQWGVAIWIARTRQWIESMQFMMRADAFGALKRLNERGFL